MTANQSPVHWAITSDDGAFCFVGPVDGVPVAKVACGNSLDHARLIAAAPVMKATLRECLVVVGPLAHAIAGKGSALESVVEKLRVLLSTVDSGSPVVARLPADDTEGGAA